MEKTYSNWLIISDIDGTLNTKFRTLPKKNFEAISRFTKAGGNFTLASGRIMPSLEPHYRRVPANAPAIILNGAAIYDFNERKIMWRHSIRG